MLSFVNSIVDPVKDCCQFILNFISDMLPFGALWTLLGLALFVVVMGGALYGIVRLLKHLHSNGDVHQVTCPFTISHIAFGLVFGAIGLFNPNAQWMTWLTIGIVGWGAVVTLLIVMRAVELKDSQHGMLFYLTLGLTYWLELFVIGLFAALVIYAAVALVIIVTVGLAVAGGMLGTAAKPSRSYAGSCGCGSHREAELEDGTRIVEEGATWREVGGYDVYRENYDGSFTKA